MKSIYYVEYTEGTVERNFSLLSENAYTSREEAVNELTARGYFREDDKEYYSPVVEGYEGWANIIRLNLLDKYNRSTDPNLASLDDDLI